MNIAQAQHIISLSANIDRVDCDKIISEKYSNRTDLENIELSQMNLSEFVFLSKKVFNLFKAEFANRSTTLVISPIYTHPQFGNGQVDSFISNYFGQINSGDVVTSPKFELGLNQS